MCIDASPVHAFERTTPDHELFALLSHQPNG
jgi:hypothetical protein